MVLRTTSTIILFSMGVIWLVGSALYTQINNRIYKEKISASISDAQSVARSTQIQLMFAQYQNKAQIPKVFANMLTDPTLDGSTLGRDFAIFPSQKLSGKLRFSAASNKFMALSVPNEFRKINRASSGTRFTKARLYYSNDTSQNGLIVGHNLTLEGIGTYEFYLAYSFNRQVFTMHLIRNASLISGLILLILIGIISFLVTSRLVSPIRSAAEIAEKIISGDLHERLRVNRTDEMGRLSTSFNDMTGSLENQITRLENLSKLQQRFVADVSHELRTPLTTIRMAAQVLYAEREKFDPTLARSVELLMNQTNRFEALLADLLEVSRFDAEAAVMETEEINLTELIRESIDYVHPSQNRVINLIAPTEPIRVVADPRRIERILRNLISNAINHRKDKPVDVTLVATDNEVAIGVRDYGEGFAETETKHLFERFWRADTSRTKVRGGSGLGLSIAKEDTNLHHGTLEAWGQPNQGAHFVLTIPRHPGGVIQSHPIELIPSK